MITSKLEFNESNRSNFKNEFIKYFPNIHTIFFDGYNWENELLWIEQYTSDKMKWPIPGRFLDDNHIDYNLMKSINNKYK